MSIVEVPSFSHTIRFILFQFIQSCRSWNFLTSRAFIYIGENSGNLTRNGTFLLSKEPHRIRMRKTSEHKI